MFYDTVFVHHGKGFEPIHYRHYDIQKHKADFQLVLVKIRKRFHTVFGFDYVVVVGKHIFKQSSVHLRIVYY